MNQSPFDPSRKHRKNRATIGFLSANIHIGAGRTLWPGIVEAARQHDANLICFPGGRLHASEGYEARRNGIYDLANPEYLDGVVSWSSAIGGELEPADVIRFHSRFDRLPLVSLAHLQPGIPAIQVNSYEGMRALVAHLIETHGYRRLAFIRGPESHYYAQERYQAYLDALAERDIPFNSQLVTRPVNWDEGIQAMGELIDEKGLRPGVDFQAVVAVSDLLALDALKTLHERRVQVPAEVAVVGFNDSIEGRLSTPPLTTVSLPFYEQGLRAVESLLDMVENDHVPPDTTLTSELVLRLSCGCPSEAMVQATAGIVPAGGEEMDQAIRSLRQKLPSVFWHTLGDSCDIQEATARLLDDLNLALRSGNPGQFLQYLEQQVQQSLFSGCDATAWHNYISLVRRHILPCLRGQARVQAEDLFGQARVVIGEMAQRVLAYDHLQHDRQNESLREIGQELITTFDIAKLADTLAQRLPVIGIRSCYLALYDRPDESLDVARLFLSYDERGRKEINPAGHRFEAHQLIPDGFWPGHRRFSLVVEPLYFREEMLGFVLFEIGPPDGSVYEVLRGYISSALKGALLFHEARQARVTAEKADQIKTRLLANVSHELRTPLNMILGYTRTALETGASLPEELISDLGRIQDSAGHQLRVINDLLDLSRAEIDELDLYPELLDPHSLLVDAFHSISESLASTTGISWRLELPERLPFIQADAVRLRQVLLNLLSNASKFTRQGHITLGAEVSPPNLHIWVEDTGVGIPPDQHERIFEPFITAVVKDQTPGGIGLGLSITRRLVALHQGSLTLESQTGHGSTFHIHLPLPSLSEQSLPTAEVSEPVIYLISGAEQPAAEIAGFCQRQKLKLVRLPSNSSPDAIPGGFRPAAIAWDLASAGPGEWNLVRSFGKHHQLAQTPFILYGQDSKTSLTSGLTGFVDKSTSARGLLDWINAACPHETTGNIFIVDDDPAFRQQTEAVIGRGLPNRPYSSFDNGASALAAMEMNPPALVVLDLIMPGMDGFDLLDRMRSVPALRSVPVLILSSKLLDFKDLKRLETHARVVFQSKDILSDEETVAALHQALFGSDILPVHTSAVVKRALTYTHQNYTRSLARWEIAEAVGVSEDYLSRLFRRELGLSPWEYLNRFRVMRSKELLLKTADSIRQIAHQVGFKDEAYFRRVFRKMNGISVISYRKESGR